MTAKEKELLEAELASYTKDTEATRSEKITMGIVSRSLDFTKDEDVKIFMNFRKGNSGIIDADKARKDDVNFVHQPLYFTCTGMHQALDEPSAILLDKFVNKKTGLDEPREYTKRVLFGRTQSGRPTMIWFHNYVADQINVEKGKCLTLNGIELSAGAETIHLGKDGKPVYTKYEKGGWLAISPFGYASSDVETLLATKTVSVASGQQTVKDKSI
jgi:hypothetical protein